MDCEVLVVGAGPAGLAVAATLKSKGRRPLVIEKADAGGRVVAQPLRAAAPAHGEDAVGAARPAVPGRRHRATCRARASSTTSRPTRRGPASSRASARKPWRSCRDAPAAGTPRRRSGRTLRLRRRGRRHRREQPCRSRRRSTARSAFAGAHRAQPRLPRRRAVRRRSACSSSAWATPAPRSPSISPSTASPSRSRCARRSTSSIATSSAGRRSRPRSCWRACRRRSATRSARLLCDVTRRRHRPLRACRARACRRCASCASTAARR